MSGSSRATSRSLLARVRAQDAGAWDRLVRLYAPFVYHFCNRARLSQEDAADVFQEVFQAAYRKIASFEKRVEGDTFRGWLRTITMNKVRDHFRRQERAPRAVGGSVNQAGLAHAPARAVPDFLPETFDPERAECELLKGALESVREQVEERTWHAFLGTTVDGRPAKDVGEELGMSAGAVRVAKSRVLQRLRTELGDL